MAIHVRRRELIAALGGATALPLAARGPQLATIPASVSPATRDTSGRVVC
jgi:hypothetical protein